MLYIWFSSWNKCIESCILFTCNNSECVSVLTCVISNESWEMEKHVQFFALVTSLINSNYILSCWFWLRFILMFPYLPCPLPRKDNVKIVFYGKLCFTMCHIFKELIKEKWLKSSIAPRYPIGLVIIFGLVCIFYVNNCVKRCKP